MHFAQLEYQLGIWVQSFYFGMVFSFGYGIVFSFGHGLFIWVWYGLFIRAWSFHSGMVWSFHSGMVTEFKEGNGWGFVNPQDSKTSQHPSATSCSEDSVAAEVI